MFQIDNQSRYPVYEQIVQQVEKYILTGIFSPGEKMPSVRSLSLQMNLNPNTVQRSYTELDRKGLIYSSSGVGTFIADSAPEILYEERRNSMQTLKPLIQELVIAGITKEEIIKMIEKIYEEDNK
ncbi:GntR family transcriptional regulator [Scatolibacter rhodanostii]|uniref:GntR family transcriptional regulator n=1 Tax=Scatolibacter rhodanostii TaxID=2014781 RepID=UPI000C07FA1B|nr:GntR family transcriptional regulator [Scatolibacter rhodanostii]